MMVNKYKCTKCGREVEPKGTVQRCECGMYYGLTPFFSYSPTSWFGSEPLSNKERKRTN